VKKVECTFCDILFTRSVYYQNDTRLPVIWSLHSHRDSGQEPNCR